MADDLTAQILADYPAFAFLLNDPEIGPLLLAAVDPNQGFDAATFQAKLMQTNWWKTHSAAARSWATTVATDPATAQQMIQERTQQIAVLASQLGLNVSGDLIAQLATNSLYAGYDVSSAEMRQQLGNLTATGVGVTGSSGESLKAIAANDYFMPLSDADVQAWSGAIAAGTQSLDAFKLSLAQQAATRWSGYADQILNGSTPSMLFAPQKNAIAQQLEVDPSTIDLMGDPTWSQVLGVPDASGVSKPMTYGQAIVLARGQDSWKNTVAGKQLSADFTSQLLHEFGAVA